MTQWYKEDKGLFEAEIKAMHLFFPNASYGFLPNGDMYWKVDIQPNGKNWTLLAVYDSDHPQQKTKYSIKVYPVTPNYNELKREVEALNPKSNFIPHILMDKNNQAYFSLALPEDVYNNSNRTISASTLIQRAKRWVILYEYAVQDKMKWNDFCYGRF